jgi:hypothetical protein
MDYTRLIIAVVYGIFILVVVTNKDLIFKFFGGLTILVALIYAFNKFIATEIEPYFFFLDLTFHILLSAVYFKEVKALSSLKTNDELVDIE